MSDITIIRGFRLNKCKSCGAPAKRLSSSDIEKNHDLPLNPGFVWVGCSDIGCFSQDCGGSTLAIAGRAWNRVN